MRVLLDYHHGDLLESLRILFEDRLGWEIYRPIGMEWYHEGYWKLWHEEVTARQYLALELSEEYAKLRDVWLNGANQEVASGIFHIPDPHHGHRYRAITLPAAKEFNFDLVLSSIPQHFEQFERFRVRFARKAHHIFQMGNNWSAPDGCKNLLNSTTAQTNVPNQVTYHQEFSLAEYTPGPRPPNVKSLTNLMHYQAHHHLGDFTAVRGGLGDWQVLDHGAGNEDGPVMPGKMPHVINDSGFIFHCKKGGEGYGYNIHNAFACGRPMVVRTSLYAGMMAAPLLTDGVTCVDLDVHGVGGAVGQLNRAAEDWDTWHANTLARFRQVVNFDAEFEQIKQFLGRLQ